MRGACATTLGFPGMLSQKQAEEKWLSLSTPSRHFDVWIDIDIVEFPCWRRARLKFPRSDGPIPDQPWLASSGSSPHAQPGLVIRSDPFTVLNVPSQPGKSQASRPPYTAHMPTACETK